MKFSKGFIFGALFGVFMSIGTYVLGTVGDIQVNECYREIGTDYVFRVDLINRNRYEASAYEGGKFKKTGMGYHVDGTLVSINDGEILKVTCPQER